MPKNAFAPSKNRLDDPVPVAGVYGPPTGLPPETWYDKAEQLSYGLGTGLTSQLDAYAQMIGHPIRTAQDMAAALAALAKNPSIAANALSEMWNKATSSPEGFGAVVGENLNPRNVLRNLARPNVQEVIGYHRTTTPFEGAFEKRKNEIVNVHTGSEGFYFSPEIDDPTASIFGRHVIEADVKMKNPAPVSQVNFGFSSAPRVAIQLTPDVLKFYDPNVRRGGLVIADSLEDAIAGKHAERPDSFKDYVKQFNAALPEGKVFAFINPETLDAEDVKLLKLKGYDGIDYRAPKDATHSMPSQIVAFDPKQIDRKKAWTEPR